MVSASPGLGESTENGRVVIRPGPSIVHDGMSVRASVRVERRASGDITFVHTGTSLRAAVDAAVEERSAGDVVTLENPDYFRRFWTEQRVADVERELRDATHK